MAKVKKAVDAAVDASRSVKSALNDILDMSTEAKLARADAQGYGPIVYHGSATEGIEAFDPSLAGSVQRSDWGRGVYLTPSEQTAKYYAKEAASRTGDDVGDALWDQYEAIAEKNGTRPMYEWMDLGSKKNDPVAQAKYAEIQSAMNAYRDHKKAFEGSNKGVVYPSRLRAKNPMYYQYEGITDPFLADQARANGHDALYIHHAPEAGQSIDDTIEEIIALDPSIIRSPDAAFDPAKRESANLLAGLGGAAVLGASVEDAEAANIEPDPMALAVTAAITGAASEFYRRRESKQSFWQQRREELSELINAGDEFIRPAMPYINSALEALDKPMQGYYGVASALGALVEGNGLDASLQRGATVARQPIEETAQEYGGVLADEGYPLAGTALNTAMQVTGPF